MLFYSIAYPPNNTGKHFVFVINIHTCKCNTSIFVITRFGLLHWYNIQDNTGWLFLIYSYTSLIGLCEIVQFLLNTVIIVNYFVRGQHRVFVIAIVTCECKNIDTTKITVRYMSSILIHRTYFSVYTIWISEHYRAIVCYSTTPSQQVSTIWWNITITVWLQSQVNRVAYYFVLMHESFTSQNTEKNHTVIISPYRVCGSKPQVVSRY